MSTGKVYVLIGRNLRVQVHCKIFNKQMPCVQQSGAAQGWQYNPDSSKTKNII